MILYSACKANEIQTLYVLKSLLAVITYDYTTLISISYMLLTAEMLSHKSQLIMIE